jgi:hypothetical protein
LYELQGFRDVLPEGLLDSFRTGKSYVGPQEMDVPDVLIMARRGHQCQWLEGMVVAGAAIANDGLILNFQSRGGTVAMAVLLDFLNEKLIFDPIKRFSIKPNRENLSCIVEELSALLFLKCVLSNGRLEFWDKSGEVRMACGEEYMPVNCFVNDEYFDDQEKLLRDLAASGDS